MGKVILIVDDDPRNQKLIRDLCMVAGYATIEAMDGKQAVELAKEKSPDLIIMDIQMPVMDGFEATRTLKMNAATMSIPVVALSAYAMAGDKQRALEAGCDGYITKPIDVRDFLHQVAAYLPDSKNEAEEQR